MITISKITDHAAKAVARLVSQFRDMVTLSGMVGALSDEAQAVEDALWDVLTNYRDMTIATGTTLDNIGSLVGAPVRGPRDDTSYQHRVQGQVVINRSSGESASVYAIGKDVIDAWDVTGQPLIRETGPGEFTVGCAPPFFHLPVPSPSVVGQTINGGFLHSGAVVAYRVSAVDAAGGETLASPEITYFITGSGNLHRVHLNWAAVAGAATYKVYGRTTGAELFIETVTPFSDPVSYFEDGLLTPAGALPSVDTSEYRLDNTLQNDDAQARELATILKTATSAGVRSIVRSRPDTVVAGAFFRFAGGSGSPRGFGVGALIGAYDR